MSALGAAISGLQTSQKWLDVISNNVSNSQTVAYKGGRANFSDLISDGLRGASGPNTTSNLGGINPSQLGLGVTVSSIQTMFKQGATQVTGNVTDVTIQGQGFLTVSKGQDTLYTRAGNLTFDRQGNLVTNDGGLVQGWQLSYQLNPVAPGPILAVTGQLNTTNTAAIGNIQVPSNLILAPLATLSQINPAIKDEGVILKGNLDSFTPPNATHAAGTGGPLVAGENPDAVTSFVVYDSLGTAYPMTMYFFQTANTQPPALLPASWDWKLFYTPGGTTPVVGATFPTAGGVVADGQGGAVGAATTPGMGHTLPITFQQNGALLTNGNTAVGTNANIEVTMVTTNGSVAPMLFSINFGTPNLAAAPPLPATYGLRDGVTGDYGSGTFDPVTGVYQPNQTIFTDFVDGYSDGQLLGLSFNTTGGIDASFSNGQTVEVAKVALTKFTNTEGLSRAGNNYFARTTNSGQGQVGTAGASGFGVITGGALEASNVDLTVELTNMILAQRMFESNARVVTASDKVLDTLVNLGR